MRLAIMQPYVFPYLGYYQLLAAVDRFVIYDDVHYIKQGWVNRNSVLVSGKPFMFTIPLFDSSSFRNINETYVNTKVFPTWQNKLMRTLEQSYCKAPYLNQILPLVESVLLQAEENNIGQVALASLSDVASYLGVSTTIVPSSTIYQNSHLSAQERVLDICRQEKADIYINPIGGQKLYSKDLFKQYGINLQFISPKLLEYKQQKNSFIPGLSIIDVLMYNSKECINNLLSNYDLL